VEFIGGMMTVEQLKAEFEKRIKTLEVHVYKFRGNFDVPIYGVRVSHQDSHAERQVTEAYLDVAEDKSALFDSMALYLVYNWAYERYLIKR
jgi:hypothetical protein